LCSHLRLDIGAILRENYVVQREIKLTGGEISILKALGLSGTSLNGKLLMDRLGDLEFAELADSLGTLIDQDYVLSTKANVNSKEDMERTAFRVNSAHARDLRDALRPGGRRREERPRRQRN
jgi:hypothetical protein